MTLNKTAVTAAPIMPVLAERWSPRAYDDQHQISQHELISVLEAARWAPSANNGQPWRFSVAVRGTELHEKVTSGLSGFNAAWAPRASALIVVSVKKFNADGSAHASAHYDAGLAVATLCVQAQELGLHTHQMAGFMHDALHASLELDDDLEVVVVVSIGKVAPPEVLEGPAFDREIAPRTRFTLDEIVLHGKP
jgi:nitroreductase